MANINASTGGPLTVNYSVTATGFFDVFGNQAPPQSTVSGNFSLTYNPAQSTNGGILNGINLFIAGTQYSTTNLGFNYDPTFGNFLVGGTVSGVNAVIPHTNDFFLYFNPANTVAGMVYSTSSSTTNFFADSRNPPSNVVVTQQPLSFRDFILEVVQPAIRWTPLPIDMTASFSPVGMTLTAAAHLGGYDHFNWYQIANLYPGSSLAGHPAPFVDPPTGTFGVPIGGLGTQRADSRPFYYDETSCFGCEARFNLYDPSNTSANDRTLNFDDLPMDIYIPSLGSKMSFSTQLVGVRSDGTWDALSTHNWSSDYHCVLVIIFCSGGVLSSRNLDAFPAGGVGGIFDSYDVPDLSDLPLYERELMVADGATNVPLSGVPEAGTLAFFTAGLAGVVATRRRKRSLSMAIA